MPNTPQAFHSYDILNHSPIGACVIDRNYIVRFWNRTLENWTNIPRELILGKKLSDFFSYFEKPSYKIRLEGIFQGGAPVIFSSQLHKHLFTQPGEAHKEQVHHTTVTAIPQPDGKTYHALFSIENVTELSQRIAAYRQMRKKNLEEIQQRKEAEAQMRKAKQRAEEADRLKSAFLANMSHEIRTPLNGIIGFADFLQKKNISPKQRKEFLQIIQSSGNHLLNLINDIIDISKIEVNQLQVYESDFSLNSLIDELFLVFTEQLRTAGKAHVFFKTQKALPDEQSHIVTDNVRLRQVLTNLLANAVKYITEGEIVLGYKLPDPDTLEFFVYDTGIGLAPEKKAAIFERFSQIDNTFTRQHGGAGLGLSISKGLVEILGGKIGVESEESKYTRFFFSLPYKPGKGKTEKQTVEKTQENMECNWEGVNILVVEDQIISAVFLQEILEECHATVQVTATGDQAVSLVQQGVEFDLVLMDIQLPGMSGYEATEKIKNLRKDLPVIAQTANALSDEKLKAYQAGCDDYLTKPIDRILLLQTLNSHLKKRLISE